MMSSAAAEHLPSVAAGNNPAVFRIALTMNQLLHWLSAGDLRSDGLSNEVVEIVLQNPALFPDLMEGLTHADDAVRGHTADALEKIGRRRPDLLLPYLSQVLSASRLDPLPMVRWHLALIFGHLAGSESAVETLIAALLPLLMDKSVFTASWAIVSLCIIGRKYPAQKERIIPQIAALQGHSSTALQSKVNHAMRLLTDSESPFPAGWVKSDHLF